jgi:hypothetical protein
VHFRRIAAIVGRVDSGSDPEKLLRFISTYAASLRLVEVENDRGQSIDHFGDGYNVRMDHRRGI